MSFGIVKELIGPVTGLLDKFIEDKDQKNALAHEIATLAQKEAHKNAALQLEVNKVEAASKSLFVSGWRPFIGWTCGLGMFGNFITIPFANFVLALLSYEIVIPLVPLETMMPVLMGMLGLGAMRSYEKTKQVAK
ncbi:holin family protein [Euryarchaeota archaeon]|nr:holin family protein [Euryarchaeota archaeon]